MLSQFALQTRRFAAKREHPGFRHITGIEQTGQVGQLLIDERDLLALRLSFGPDRCDLLVILVNALLQNIMLTT